MYSQKNLAAVIILSLIFVSVQNCLYANERDNEKSFYVKRGTYLEIFGVNNAIGGDFDDSRILYSYYSFYDLPDIDSGMGFGLALGLRDEKGALELSYQRSTHDTSSSFIFIGSQKAYLNALDLNLKIDAFAKDEIRPHILLGCGIPFLTIENSKLEGYYSFDDETFFGVSGHLGCGLSYFLNPQICITGGAAYRWMWFSSVDGVDIDESLSAGGLSFRLGLAYTF